MKSVSVETIRAFLRRIPISLWIAIFGLSVTAAAWLNVLHRSAYESADEIERVHKENGGLARAFEEHARRVIKTADNVLLYLQMEYEKHGKVTASMVDFVALAKQDPILNQIALVNADGFLILSAVPNKRPVNIADVEHFQVQAKSANAGLYIGKPLVSRVAGTWSFFLTRRLTRPDGTFAGIVSVGLDPTYFSDYYGIPELGEGRSMLLVGRDGIVRARHFQQQSEVGQNLAASPLFAEIQRKPTGSFEVVSTIDGRQRLASYRLMPDYPLIVAVSEIKTTALASFMKRKGAYYRSALLFTLFVAGFCIILIRAQEHKRRQNKRLTEELAERKKAEESLRESQGLFSAFMDHFPAVVFVKDLQGKILYSNQAFKALFGHDMIGESSQERLPQEWRTSSDDQRLLRERAATVEQSISDQEGRERTFETRVFAVDRGDKEPLLGTVAVDISGRRHAQKMEAIGTFAGGVAHDFNNILTAIIGYGDLLRMKMVEGAAGRNYVDHMLSASHRAADLTRSLLAFSRKQVNDPQVVDLNDIVRNIEKLLKRLIGEDVILSTELAGQELTVMADVGQMEQVIMNLAANARDAMPEGGEIIIKTEAGELDEEYCKSHGYGIPGEYGVLAISDTGSGMDKKTARRVFEPFFTTKEVGKGTGLGLSIAYGIIKQHNGYINVYSEAGEGTTFRVYLPLIKSSPGKARPAVHQPVTGGTETILIAEDDAEVRSLTRLALEEFGYDVLEAEDGEDAVTKFRENRDRVRLVILDVIMPRKNGKEAHDEIKKLTPDIKVIFTSGYTADLISRKGIAEGKLNFIAKPHSPHDLLKMVREVLDAPAGG